MNPSFRKRFRRRFAVRQRQLRWRLRSMRPSRSGLAVAAIALAVAITVPVALVVQATARTPETMVIEYLDAVHDKDIDRALDLSGWRPRGEQAKFLTRKALDDDWSFDTVDETDRAGDRATVAATLRGGDATTTAEFELTQTPEGWILRDPFVSLRFTTASMTFAEANGVTAKAAPPSRRDDHLFFPGRYEFYAGAAGNLDIEPVDTMLAPGGLASLKPLPRQLSTSGAFDLGKPKPTPPGLAAVSRAVAKYIDSCAKSDDLEPDRCPFGTSSYVAGLWDSGYITDERDLTWTVTKYPTVEAKAGDRGFAVSQAKSGRVKLAYTAVEKDYDPGSDEYVEVGSRKVKGTCGFDLSGLVLRLDADGEWEALHHRADKILDDDPAFRPDADVETCD